MIPIRVVTAQGEGSSAANADSANSASSAKLYLQPGLLQLRSLPPLSLYIHFPWCVRKCPYCDFNSHQVKDTSGQDAGFPEQEYLAALRRDLELALPLIWGRKIQTVFIGGGTPSLMSAAGLDQLLSDMRSLLALDSTVEITLEANPGTFESEKFKSYRASGINRLSIGIQSFAADKLKALGRIHDDEQARRAVEIAGRHFDNFNLDLMYALPGQSMEELRQDLQQAFAFAPPHLSLYHLTLEPNTLFAKFPPVLPDDDVSAEMQDFLLAETERHGYQHYETSAYAQPGRRARHNLNYWEFGDYLGIGAGAHSKLSFPHRIVRQMRYKQPQAYLQQIAAGTPIQEEFEVGRNDLGFEFMLNAMRLTEGVALPLFAERTGLSLNSIEPALQEAERRGLLYCDHQIMRPTELGQRFLNDLQQLFLPDTEEK